MSNEELLSMSLIKEPLKQEVGSLSFTGEQIELIKQQIAKDATNQELALFLSHCQTTGLNPLANQIYFQKRSGKAVFITSIDGFRLIAARTGEHAGTDDSIFDDEKQPNKATVTVYRIVKGHRYAFTASARWDEYCPGKGLDFMWHKMPCTMLGKCAESLALRKAFPNELGNMYTKEEMDQAETPSKPDSSLGGSAENQKPIVTPIKQIAPSKSLLVIVWDRLINELHLSEEESASFIKKVTGKQSKKDLTPTDLALVNQRIDDELINSKGDAWESDIIA